jgi:hypothetical protein
LASSARFAELCIALPALRTDVLRLLGSALRCAGSAAAPLVGAAADLLAEHMAIIAVGGARALTPVAPVARLALYAATEELLRLTGMGAPLPLLLAALRCVEWEIYGRVAEDNKSSGSGRVVGHEARQPPKKKPRKGSGGADTAGIGNGAPSSATDDAGSLAETRRLEAQEAALGMLSTLLTSCTAALDPADRARGDAIAAHAATVAADATRVMCRDLEGDAAALGTLRLAALRALLASVLAPTDHRPAFFPLALRLFREGLVGEGAALIAPFCAHVSLFLLRLVIFMLD